MKTTVSIKMTILRTVMLVSALSMTLSAGSAQVGNQKNEPFVISTIMPLNLLDYAASLKVNTFIMEDIYEAEPVMESWMVNTNGWSSSHAGFRSLLTEETEEPMEIESWMLEDFGTGMEGALQDETVTEEKAPIESWMLHPETWGK